jgi:hypothetical protein
MVRLFDASGIARGPEFPVTEEVEGSHRSYAIDMDGGGRFVVVWADDTEKEKAVKARVFSPEGQPETSTIEVHRHQQKDGTSNPEVVWNQNGGFLISWGISVPKEGGNELHLALFNGEGTLLKLTKHLDDGCGCGSFPSLLSFDWGYAFAYTCMMPMKASTIPPYPIRLGFLSTSLESAHDTAEAGHALHGQHLAVLSDGRFLISNGMDASIHGPDGVMEPKPLVFVEDLDIIFGAYGHVASSAGGRFASVWSGYDKKGIVGMVKMRIMGSDGTAVTGEIIVNNNVADREDRHLPRIDMTPDGRIIVVWEATDQHGDGARIYAQRFTRDGEPMGVMPW